MPLSIPFRAKLSPLLARRVSIRLRLAGGLEVNEIEVRIANLPPSLQSFCIAQISDIHVGAGLWTPLYAGAAARRVLGVRPDVTVNTGDYLQARPSIDKVMAVTRRFMPADATDRPYLTIFGNHDYVAGDDAVRELTRALEDASARILVNRTTHVVRGDARVTFAGFSLDAPGFEEAVRSLLSSPPPRIVLVHEPEVAEHLPEACADLVLAGHTHGGQITLPGLEPLIVRQFCGSHYVQGMYHVREMPLYVNRGIGCTGLPLRFRARPEVTLIRLAR